MAHHIQFQENYDDDNSTHPPHSDATKNGKEVWRLEVPKSIITLNVIIIFLCMQVAFVMHSAFRSIEEKKTNKVDQQPVLAGCALTPDNVTSSAIASKSSFHASKIFMVMGPKEKFHEFVEIVREASKNHPLSFIYASFDFEIEDAVSAGCLLEGSDQQNNRLDCKTMFIPNTTWTEGRNLLAEEVVRKERKNGKEYKYWIFADDDLDMHCDCMEDTVDQNVCCWSKVLSFFDGDDIPDKVTSLSVLPTDLPPTKNPKFWAVSTADAMIQAFKRDYIPYVMPYATLEKGISEWSSQAAIFCVFETCFESSIMWIPNVTVNNEEHRPYTRGSTLEAFKDTIAKNYHDSDAGFFPCANARPQAFGQLYQKTAEFDTAEELNEAIPPNNLEKCNPLVERYKRWERQIE